MPSKIAKINRDLFVLFILGLFLRLLFIHRLTTFLGDQGVDFINIHNIVEKKFSLIGPTSSILGLYNGPLFYYLIAPFFKISGYNLVVPAIVIAALNSLAVFPAYFAAKELTKNRHQSFLVATVFALSPLLVYFSKISWTPFPSIFFLTFFYLFLIKALRKNSIFWLARGILAGLSSQLHYLNYLTIPTTLIPLLACKKKKILGFCLFIFGFIIGDLPIILFEVRHNFLNFTILANNLLPKENSLIAFAPLISGVKIATIGILRVLVGLMSFPLLLFAFSLIFFRLKPLFFNLTTKKTKNYLFLLIPILSNFLTLSFLGVSQKTLFLNFNLSSLHTFKPRYLC